MRATREAKGHECSVDQCGLYGVGELRGRRCCRPLEVAACGCVQCVYAWRLETMVMSGIGRVALINLDV